jgi:hypothetical protein
MNSRSPSRVCADTTGSTATVKQARRTQTPNRKVAFLMAQLHYSRRLRGSVEGGAQQSLYRLASSNANSRRNSSNRINTMTTMVHGEGGDGRNAPHTSNTNLVPSGTP